MAKDKYLYTFTVPREIEKEVEEETTEGKLIRKVKVTEDVKFAILRPTRQILDEADLFHGVQLARGLEAGLMPQALLSKKYANNEGVFSDTDLKRIQELRNTLFELTQEITLSIAKTESERSETEKAALSEAINKTVAVQTELQKYEMVQNSLFEYTAEARARIKTIVWYLLHLSYVENKPGEFTRVFGEGEYDTKLSKYDSLLEGAEEYLRVGIERLGYFITFLYQGKASTKEDFEALEANLLATKAENGTDA